jgi:hypothetical protein
MNIIKWIKSLFDKRQVIYLPRKNFELFQMKNLWHKEIKDSIIKFTQEFSTAFLLKYPEVGDIGLLKIKDNLFRAVVYTKITVDHASFEDCYILFKCQGVDMMTEIPIGKDSTMDSIKEKLKKYIETEIEPDKKYHFKQL